MYPYFTCQQSASPFPLFGNQLRGVPCFLDLSSHNSTLETVDVINQHSFQKYIEELMGDQFTWGVASYLEYRSTLLSHLPQMRKNNRFFHLGLDIIVPIHSQIYAPLTGQVVEADYEPGDGNFGGYLLLKHQNEKAVFYSLYGHLDPKSLPVPGQIISTGEKLAQTGDFEVNGNWFYHTHLQILTERGKKEGYLHKGYCTADDLAEIRYLCPDPLYLFRY